MSGTRGIHLSEYCARIDTLKLTNHKERARPNILNYSRYTAESQELRSNKMIEILWNLKRAQREIWRQFCFNLLLICTCAGGCVKSLGKVWGIQKWSFAGSRPDPTSYPKLNIDFLKLGTALVETALTGESLYILFQLAGVKMQKVHTCKVHIFWEGQNILRNLPFTFHWHYIRQK